MSETKYGDRIDDDHWNSDDTTEPPAWTEETTAPNIEIDVQVHHEGYQTDKKWTVQVQRSNHDDHLTAIYAVQHQNKGTYWREGDWSEDIVDFVDLPMKARRRVAEVLNRELSEITPDEPLLASRREHTEDPQTHV